MTPIIIIDQGMKLEYYLFLELGKFLSLKRHQITAYHPQSNGIPERWYRMLKAAIKAQDNLSSYLAYGQSAAKRLLQAPRTLCPGRT